MYRSRRNVTQIGLYILALFFRSCMCTIFVYQFDLVAGHSKESPVIKLELKILFSCSGIMI